MKHYQDTETGMIYAFEDDYDPLTANNRNLPTTLIEDVIAKPDESHVWFQGGWAPMENVPADYSPPISSVPAYNPAWIVHQRPYTAIHRDESSDLRITLDQINNNSYCMEKLGEVVVSLPLGNASSKPALVSYDGAIAIPQCDDYPDKSSGVQKLNEVLCCILLGGIHAEVLHPEELVIGALYEGKKLFAYTPSLHSSLRLGTAALQDRLMPLMNPRVLLIEDLQAAYSQGRQVAESIENFSPYFILNGYTAMVYRNNSDALNNLWICVEQLTEYLWVHRYQPQLETLPARLRRCHLKLKKRIDSNQIKAKHALLRLTKIISKECQQGLSEARLRRNALAHSGTVPESKSIEMLWKLIPELLETASRIQSLGMRLLMGGVVENWEAPVRTNFDEWMALAEKVGSGEGTQHMRQ